MEGRIVHSLFLGRFDSLAVLASNDLDLLSRNHLVPLHLERRTLDDKCPDIVTQTVGFQMALEDGKSVWRVRGKLMAKTHLEGRLGLDLLDHSIRQRFVKLRGRGKLRNLSNTVWNVGLQTCWRTFIANWGVIAPLVISSSKESVRAIPILLI